MSMMLFLSVINQAVIEFLFKIITIKTHRWQKMISKRCVAYLKVTALLRFGISHHSLPLAKTVSFSVVLIQLKRLCALIVNSSFGITQLTWGIHSLVSLSRINVTLERSKGIGHWFFQCWRQENTRWGLCIYCHVLKSVHSFKLYEKEFLLGFLAEASLQKCKSLT